MRFHEYVASFGSQLFAVRDTFRGTVRRLQFNSIGPSSCLCACPSVYVRVFLSLSLSLSFCLSLSPALCLSLSLSLPLSSCICIYACKCMYVYIYMYVYVYLCVYMQDAVAAALCRLPPRKRAGAFLNRRGFRLSSCSHRSVKKAAPSRNKADPSKKKTNHDKTEPSRVGLLASTKSMPGQLERGGPMRCGDSRKCQTERDARSNMQATLRGNGWHFSLLCKACCPKPC